MTISIRPLYTRVGLARPDVDNATIGTCIREAYRAVCMDTELATETVSITGAGLTVGNSAVPVALTSGRELLTVLRVRVKPAAGSYTDMARVSAEYVKNFGLESAANAAPYCFVQSGQSISVYPAPDVTTYTVQVQASWAPLPSSDDDTPITSAGLPTYISPALEALAESYAFLVPGPGQDLDRAEKLRADYFGMLGKRLAIPSKMAAGGDR